MKRLILLTAVLGLSAFGLTSCHGGIHAYEGIFFDEEDIASTSTSTAAYARMENIARGTWDAPRFDDLEHDADIQTLAGATVAIRENDAGLKTKVINQLKLLDNVPDADYDRTLEMSRNLGAYPIAADLIGWGKGSSSDEQTFVYWLTTVKSRVTNQSHGCSGGKLLDSARCSANNWGSMARFSVAAINAYLYNFDTSTTMDTEVRDPWWDYVGFHPFSSDPIENYESGDATSWACHQPTDEARAGIEYCPSDSTRNGGLPEELRRGGTGWTPPPGPFQNYVHGATQANVATAVLLTRYYEDGNYRNHGDNAIPRSMAFIYDRMTFPPEGNDAALTWLYNSFWPDSNRSTEALDATNKIYDFTDAVTVDFG